MVARENNRVSISNRFSLRLFTHNLTIFLQNAQDKKTIEKL